jgi:hypothetical protein
MAADVAAYLQAQQVQAYLQAQQQAAQQAYLQSPLAAQQAYLSSPIGAQQRDAAAQVQDLAPSELQNFAQKQDDLNQTYGQQKAQTAYARGGLQQNQTANVANLSRQYDQQRAQLPGAYAHRGLLNSGIYAQGLQNYGIARTDAFGNADRTYQQALGQNDLTGQQTDQSYRSATAGIAGQRTARRADLAAQLRAVQ